MGDFNEVIAEHPDPSRYLSVVEPVNHLDRDAPARASEGLPTLVLGTELFHIGEFDEPADYVLGEVKRAYRDEGGRVVVLDSRNQLVRYYDAEGEFLHSAGGAGAGPGEFMIPSALALEGKNVYVSDIRTLRITQFRRISHELTRDRTHDLSVITPHDMCALEHKIVVHGRDMEDPVTGSLIYVFTDQFERTNSFGRVYESDHPSIQRSMSVGRILCIPPDMIVFVSEGLPLLAGYSIEGSLEWTTVVDAYTPFPYIQYADRIVNSVPKGGGNFLAGLAHAPNGWVVLQIAKKTLKTIQDGRLWDSLDTYAISANTGRGVYLGSHYPLLAQVGDSAAVVVRELPYPQVKVYRAEVNFPSQRRGQF